MNIKKYSKNIIYIDNSNSGTNKKNTIFIINYVIESYKDKNILLIIGEESKNICEGFPYDDILHIINKYYYRVIKFIVIGKKLYQKIKMKKNIYYSESLEKSFNIVNKIIKENEIIISCVKCFR